MKAGQRSVRVLAFVPACALALVASYPCLVVAQTNGIGPPLSDESTQVSRSSRIAAGGTQTGGSEVRSTLTPTGYPRPNGRG